LAIQNSKGVKLNVGMTARYVGTGTIGRIVKLEIFEGKVWALLDTTNLYYDVEYIEPSRLPEHPRKGSEKARREEVLEKKVEEELATLRKLEEDIIKEADKIAPTGAG